MQTGYEKADKVLNRLNSSDPDFDDCADAAALIFELVADRGPEGALWKDAAIDERVKRVAAEAEIARLTETNQKLSDALDKALGENEQMKDFIRQFDMWQEAPYAKSLKATDPYVAYEVWKARKQLQVNI